MVNREATVGITVVGDADVSTVFEHRGGEYIEVGRADSVIDVVAIGIGADYRDGGTGIRKDLRRDSRGGSIGAVEHHMDAFEPVRKRREEMQDIAIFSIRETADATNLDTGRSEFLLAESGFDAVFDLVRQLGAPGGEELDAVVGGRVMRCRDHHSEVGFHIRDQECGRRSRDDSGVEYIHARACKTRHDRRGDELARDPRIASHNTDRPTSGGATTISESPFAEHDGCRLGKPDGDFHRDDIVRKAPNAIGAEEARHGSRSAGAR